jgi:hypothetical protein
MSHQHNFGEGQGKRSVIRQESTPSSAGKSKFINLALCFMVVCLNLFVLVRRLEGEVGLFKLWYQREDDQMAT